MNELLVYLRPYRKEAILAPLFKALEALFDLLVPLVMAYAIDQGIARGDKALVWVMCFALVTIALIGLTMALTAQYYAARVATGFGSSLRRTLFRRAQSFSFAQFDRFGADTLVTRMTSDVNQAQTAVNLTLRLFLRSPFIVAGAAVMAFIVDARASLLFLATIPVLAVVIFGVTFATIPMYRRTQTLLDTITSVARENLVGVRVIRAFNRQGRERAEFHNRNARLSAAQRIVGAVAGLMNPCSYVVINLAILALLYSGAARVDSGALTQGQLVALINYMSQILIELIKLANMIVQINKGLACAERIAEIITTKDDMKDGDLIASASVQKSNAPVIRFDHVSVTYSGRVAPALSDVSFEIPQGATVCVLGGSGSGKSTLVNLIPRFYDVEQGCVEVFGQDVRRYTLQSLRALIAVTPQTPQAFKGTILENLRVGKHDASVAEAQRALELAQGWEFVERSPGALDFQLESLARNLSGGQRQRLTIARALIKDAPILILDDASSALDFATDAKLREALATQRAGRTTIIVSQRAVAARHADCVLVLERGRLCGIGSHEELLRHNEVYQEIYYSQFPEGDAELSANVEVTGAAL
ncbi:MAG: ABC transporter ATP-binding protein [Planctomycetia bacterium]|nr:ABC transporter ATP-binding protein [Planctomycetia bacterium]